ncbi:DUF3422 domain-containing protein [Leeia sp. TBRC 13508]|uniref:DUF3422 domain-containing protein n=1 Tax=Leeia speluncae TaxID=2884804 RepID=A0ABS8D836_9NEIS|nr:DUF3422 domain-containing protein [Leeia speluncae]MCB6184360.1 DUF3422 domain-containing protein [Leeia speluncae]
MNSPQSLNEHPLRQTLNDEAHARPYFIAPLRSQVTALVLTAEDLAKHRASITKLCEEWSCPIPPSSAGQHTIQSNGLTIRWDVHTEFVRYTFIRNWQKTEGIFTESPLSAVPQDWLTNLPGQVLVAIHTAVLPKPTPPLDLAQIANNYFDGNDLIGSEVGDGKGVALTDLRLHPDPHLASGASRILLLDGQMGQRQSGRMLQRLLEVETYRILALLSLPQTKQLLPQLAKMEKELSELTTAIRTESAEDKMLLNNITQLAGGLENSIATSSYRFGATRAYYALIERRIDELRESRLQGLQPFREFVERRLAPAIHTTNAVSTRQEQLSLRLQRTTALLRTRVDIASEAQRHGLLDSMNRRAALQLRLQETVEGLSVAVLTYYIVGLVGYASKALHAVGLEVNYEMTTGFSIPIVAGLVAYGMHRFKKKLAAHH